MGKRSDIIAKFAEVLLDTCGSPWEFRVQRSPSKAIPDELLAVAPILQVFWLDESSEVRVMDPREYRRGLSVAVRGIVMENDDETREELLDSLADDIENALESNTDLMSIPGAPSPVGINAAFTRVSMESSIQGRKGLGAVLLVYEVAYDTARPATKPTLDEFLDGKTTFHHAGTPDDPDEVDPRDEVSRPAPEEETP